jgi:hypothetical protein
VLEPLKPAVEREAAAPLPRIPALAASPLEVPLAALAALRSELTRAVGELSVKSPVLVALLAHCEELLADRGRGGAPARAAEVELASLLESIDAVMEGLLLRDRGGQAPP